MNNQNMQNIPTPIIETSGLNRFYTKVYLFFALGLGISGCAAYFGGTIFKVQMLNFIQSFPLGFVGLWLVEIGLVVLLSAKARKNPALSLAGFIVYSLLNGITLSITLMYYNIDTIYQAFGAACATFVAAAVVGIFTKKDLSIIGRFAITALVGLIISLLLNALLFRSGPMDLLLSVVSVLIFTGLTAYDNQMIRRFYQETKGQENTGIAAFVALQLYLDFINLFYAFLRIIGRNN